VSDRGKRTIFRLAVAFCAFTWTGWGLEMLGGTHWGSWSRWAIVGGVTLLLAERWSRSARADLRSGSRD
jgi:hypothetical protein